MKTSAVLLPAIVLFSLATTNAFAWGPDGHKIVCRIAYELLDSDAQRAEVDRLVEAYKLPNHIHGLTSFPEACTFADRARGNAVDGIPGWHHYATFNSWHFLNVPRTVHHVAETFCHDNCVTHAITFHSHDLGNTHLSDQKRAEALLFLGHWLGDIHQPLHVSFADDQGGNKIPVTGGFYKPVKLHSVWDGGLIFKTEGPEQDAWIEYADRLKSEITDAKRAEWVAVATPIEWADESYAISTTPDVLYCHWVGDTCKSNLEPRTLGQAYQDEFQDDVSLRLQQAGVRLAELIRTRIGK